MYRRILVATDFSKASTDAMAYAVDLALRDSAELHVIFVEVLHGNDIELTANLRDGLPPDHNGAGLAALDALEFPSGLNAVTRLTRGVSAAPAIIGYAAEHGMDLVVVGSHGRTGLARWFIGSVAQEVVRASPVPVLVVRGAHAAPRQGPFRVLAPVDFSEASRQSLRAASGIAKARGGQLIALHAIDLTRLPPYYTMELEAEKRRHVERELTDWMREAQAPSTAQPIVRDGTADETIVECARDHDAHLIVMGASGHTILEQLLVGSVTERVLRSAPCPILAYRKPRRGGPAERMRDAA